MQTENLRVTNMVPTMQAKVQGLEKEVRRTKSDLDHKTKDAENYKNQVYSLQVELESTVARLGEEMQLLRDTLKSMEGERDALKTSLKEEEVMRIAAEGNIALPTASADENDEFGSPVRSPQKHRNMQREDDDKENVAPKKAMVELKLLQQELATEKRLRERAVEQIDFMKMECQFQCCSCRIAENQGKTYVHDNTYMTEMQRIKTSVPVFTPPPSAHEDDAMEGVITKQERVDDRRPFTPPAEDAQVGETEATLTFSPSTGTFRAVPSPVKAHASTHISTPAKPPSLGLSAVTETFAESSSWSQSAPSIENPVDVAPEKASRRSMQKENITKVISIHEDEDAIEDEDEDETETDSQSTLHDQYAPTTPARYELHTTTTTIPIAFSPATPAFRPGNGPMTPSTVAHMASDARTPVLGELALNKLPIDREAALRQIRERRGRARSFQAGHGTPMKQMVEGVKERRDISAPVSRGRK
jgi:hypothetical protein